MDSKTKKCLFRWQDYSSTVTVAVQTLRFDEELLDVTLACEGNTIRAHKLVLAASSLYFRQILREHPCDHPTIVIDGIEWKNLLSILHFMYNGQVLVEEDSVLSLLAAAASLAVIGLSCVTAALVCNKVGLSEKQCISFPKNIEGEKDIFQKCSSIEDYQKAQICSNSPSLDVSVSLHMIEPMNSLTEPKDILIDLERKDNSETIEPPEKKQKHCSKLRKTTRSSIKRHPTTEEDVIDPEILKSTSLKKEILNTNDNKRLEINGLEMEVEKVDLYEEVKNEIRFSHFNKISKTSIANGFGYLTNSSLTSNNEFDLQDSQDDSSLENGDMDLGPAPLPLNHPAVLAAAAASSSAAEAEAASDGSIAASLDSINDINTISYAAFLSATGILPSSSIGNGSLSNSPSSHLPWLPSINEMNQSPSSIYCLNTSQLSGMSPHELQATLEQYQRKLAFHEPRPCPTCSRMYRDAATLRTHIAIMHSEGREPYTCTCGSVFRTKYDMYQHRKNGHR